MECPKCEGGIIRRGAGVTLTYRCPLCNPSVTPYDGPDDDGRAETEYYRRERGRLGVALRDPPVAVPRP